MNNELEHIFSDTPCPSEEMLIRYLEGKLSDTEKHNVEMHLNGCDMCSDFVDGLSEMSDIEELPHIEKELHKKIDNLIKTEKKTDFTFYLKIAASIILIAGLTFLIYYQYPHKKTENIEVAQNKTPVVSGNDSAPPPPPTVQGPADEEINNIPKNAVSGSKTQDFISDEPAHIALKKPNAAKDIIFESHSVPAATRAKEDTKSSGYVYDRLAIKEDKEEPLSKNLKDESKPASPDVVIAEEAEKVVTGDVTTISTTNQGREQISLVKESKIISGKKTSKEKSKNERYNTGSEGKTANAFAQAEAPVQENAPVGGVISDDDDSKKQPQKVVRDKFNDGEYQQVLQLLDTLPMDNKNDEENQYYRGVSYYKTGQYQKAYNIFTQLVSSKSPYLKNEIQWYYALTLLSIGQKEEAKKQFENIATGASPYAPDARKELDKLK